MEHTCYAAEVCAHGGADDDDNDDDADDDDDDDDDYTDTDTNTDSHLLGHWGDCDTPRKKKYGGYHVRGSSWRGRPTSVSL